ncbi:MAG: sulfotransferase domain-containing protein [Candidatus Ozemobacteraceae bacterium]
MKPESIDNDIEWPEKEREEDTIEANSRIWNEFEFRKDDVIVASYHKAGTTLTQQIASQLIFNGQKDVPVAKISPWLDFRLIPKEQVLAQLKAQTHGRCIKTHLPADALVINPQAKYIYVARDGRDIAWSLHRHLLNALDTFNDAQWKDFDPQGKKLKGYPKIPESPHQFFLDWLRDDGFPHGSFFENVRTWWKIRSLPNVLLVHYNILKQDLRGEIIKIARFLNISLEGLMMDDILLHCSFQYMKEHSINYAPLEGKVFKGGHESFFYKGTNDRWVGSLSAEEIKIYEKTAEERLGKACANWIATGQKT